MTNPLEKPVSERLKDLQDLREKGFQPWALVLFIKVEGSKHIGELVSYPFATKEGYKINMRTKIGDPTSMIEVKVGRVWTAEELADMTPDPTDEESKQISAFLNLIAPILRKRGSC